MTVEAWERRHPGIRASGLVRLWLRSLEPLARGLRGVPPSVLTVLGGLASLVAVVAPPRRAAGLLAAGGVFDALDGMVAVEPSPRGRLLDHGVDRLADVALLSGLARRGAPRHVCLAALVAVVGQELSRGRSTIVTPGERPTRIILGMLGLQAFPGLAAGAIGGLSAVSWLMLRRDRQRSLQT